MFRLNITEKAEQDLLDNASYIKEVLHAEKAAENLVDGFYSAIQKVIHSPKAYPLVNNDLLKPYGVRFLQIKNFTVFFNLDEENKEIFVLRFIYSRRNWKALLGEDFPTAF